MARSLKKLPAASPVLDQVTTLQRRLDDGYRRIEDAARAGKDVDAWEAFWIDLLRQYEALCDSLNAAEAA